MTKFVGLEANSYSYLIIDSHANKIVKGSKYVIKTKLKLENYKNCLEATQIDNKRIILKKMELTLIVLKKIINNS